jgi:hypothetical protein
MVTSLIDPSKESPIEDAELIRAYCRLLQNTRTYRLFKLEHMCAVNVAIFNQQVNMGMCRDFTSIEAVFTLTVAFLA